MKSWPILLAAMLLALTTSTLGNFDANALDKGGNQVKTRSLDEDQDEDHGEDLYGSKRKRRFLLNPQSRFKHGISDKINELNNDKFKEDVSSLSDLLKKKIKSGVTEAVAEHISNLDKFTKDIVSGTISKILDKLTSHGPEAKKRL